MTATREETLENLRELREGIGRACERAERDPSTVRLVAASKTVPLEHMRWVHEAGVTDFGENYVQELRAKRPELPHARWHYIGTLQTGSAHHVAALADVVQTVAGGRATDRLARRVVQAGRAVDVLIEVDFTGERTGVPPERTQDLADRIASLEGLRLIGLMTLPPMSERAGGRPTVLHPAARPAGSRPRTAPRGAGIVHGDVVGLPGRSRRRRYDGPRRDGAVRSPGAADVGRK